MSPAISTVFTFERLGIALRGAHGPAPYDAYGEATVVGDRRTWRITALSVDMAGVRLPSIKAGTALFEEIRVALHRQCGAEIAERMNRAVEEQGGYAILFGEDIPVDRFERGRDSFGAHDRVWPIAA